MQIAAFQLVQQPPSACFGCDATLPLVGAKHATMSAGVAGHIMRPRHGLGQRAHHSVARRDRDTRELFRWRMGHGLKGRFIGIANFCGPLAPQPVPPFRICLRTCDMPSLSLLYMKAYNKEFVAFTQSSQPAHSREPSVLNTHDMRSSLSCFLLYLYLAIQHGLWPAHPRTRLHAQPHQRPPFFFRALPPPAPLAAGAPPPKPRLFVARGSAVHLLCSISIF